MEYFVILLLMSVLICESVVNCCKQLLDLDPELENAIKLASPEFASSLKRRFTNAGIGEEFRSRESIKPVIQLEDTFFQDDRNQVALRDLSIEKLPIARLSEVVPNLLEKNVRISADWYNVTVKGSYEMTNTSQLQMLPVRNAGIIEIKIEKIGAGGLVGFQIYGDALKTTNFNLKFKAENVNIQVEYNEYETNSMTISNLTRKNIDKTLVKYIKRDLYWKLQEALRTRLDQVLVDFSVTELFQEDLEISKNQRSENVDDFINRLVDRFLIEVRGLLISKGFSNITAPDFKTDFSHKFGVLTFWGTFEASNGFIYDLSLIKRTGNFSIATVPNSDDFEIWGSLGLPDLQLKYSYYYARIWNIGPWGDLHASVGENSVNFKIITEIRNLMELDFIVKDYDFKVVQLENVKVNATGLSVLLNWLLSYIATWITGLFKQDIVIVIEEQIRSLFEKFLPVNLL